MLLSDVIQNVLGKISDGGRDGLRIATVKENDEQKNKNKAPSAKS